jgi:hypothetical protein
MFQLTNEEYEAVKFQIKNLEPGNSLRFQIETSKGSGGSRVRAGFSFLNN